MKYSPFLSLFLSLCPLADKEGIWQQHGSHLSSEEDLHPDASWGGAAARAAGEVHAGWWVCVGSGELRFTELKKLGQLGHFQPKKTKKGVLHLHRSSNTIRIVAHILQKQLPCKRSHGAERKDPNKTKTPVGFCVYYFFANWKQNWPCSNGLLTQQPAQTIKTHKNFPMCQERTPAPQHTHTHLKRLELKASCSWEPRLTGSCFTLHSLTVLKLKAPFFVFLLLPRLKVNF